MAVIKKQNSVMIDFFMVVEFKYMPFTVLAKVHKVLKKRGL